ncbi:2,3-diaminopropionate biosynthesis protein SbnB [Xenorhabdus bovienii]|uniref:Ornithine cyclodeaminase/mu-crystallin n=1 Tax=Xenorhabdus bovienii str. kraussei Becker Underwood TaxID=1398204 RepID=A0A077Q177_XENBV|nr:2,3-diaminopropionate biosynthesis protein SbnB [Xenorhabdus bovienii]CDH26802.1 Ornithine cyclodeaminase/mu-crystallin [Xenorhabdus bovienii str. kraussei Becker Underwood]
MNNLNFDVVTGETIRSFLDDSYSEVMRIVRETYLLHEQGLTNNPDSYFLRFDDKPEARIIALPAAKQGADAVAGIKWIASYPKNVANNLQRASATILLNNYETGYPFALLEASQISAFRTAASAVLAANTLKNNHKVARKIAFVGAGIIARKIADFFRSEEWAIGEISAYDLNSHDAEKFSHYIKSTHTCESIAENSLDAAIREADIIVFATNAGVPYVTDFNMIKKNQIVLNISLRDISPEIILNSANIFDDVEHCMKANTSPHLAEQLSGGRSFVDGTLAGLIRGEVKIRSDCPVIFSPFGLGVLDLVIAAHLYRCAVQKKRSYSIPGFFPDMSR